jgi:cyclic di-GMP phosphodiesterase
LRLLLVDDDAGLRALLRTTFEVVDIEVDEASDAGEAGRSVAARRPDVIVLDVLMPGENGIEFCRRLKTDRATRDIPVVLLTGSEGGTLVASDAAGADAFVRKPFSPLELLAVVERLAGGLYGVPFRTGKKTDPEEQVLLYARDLRHLLELERGQRVLLQDAYRETVGALASALESKDTGTRAHSQRVQLYATELARAVAPELVHEPATEYGFLLHDVGKIGIPDHVLQKPGPLTAEERRLMQTHTVLGEQMLGGVAFLRGEGLRVVRSHHERWDGGGYPDGLAGDEIPLSARIFCVADTLDAMTSDRPYRKACPWTAARTEVARLTGAQFDPAVVDAFHERESQLREICRRFETAA